MPLDESQGVLGGGVQIRLHDPSAIMNPRLAQFAIETARREGIPHQVTVRSSGGTDAGSFTLANEGIPSVVLGTHPQDISILITQSSAPLITMPW